VTGVGGRDGREYGEGRGEESKEGWVVDWQDRGSSSYACGGLVAEGRNDSILRMASRS
jgi:hypothetical protein